MAIRLYLVSNILNKNCLDNSKAGEMLKPKESKMKKNLILDTSWRFNV